MSVAVLKNRILDLTGRAFQESDYGVSTFREFVLNHGDLLELDDAPWPPVVILKEASFESAPSAQSRIRSDLWRAVLNFSGSERYVWDNQERVARATGDTGAPGPLMPTITVDQFNQWKTTFASSVAHEARDDRLVEWMERPLPASYLLPHLKHRWNAFLKTAVHERLLAWFKEQDISPPPDLLTTRGEGVTSSSSERLRKRLIACLRSMTHEELERVQIPSSVLLRAKWQ